MAMQSVADALSHSFNSDRQMKDKAAFKLRADFQALAATWRERAVGSYGVSVQQADVCVDMALDDISRAIGECESPIERALLPHLLFQPYADDHPAPARISLRSDDIRPPAPVVVVPQFAFIRCRIDFAVIAKVNYGSVIVAVECDGAEFHNVEKDRRRDAFLASWGIPTVRASGKDISREAQAVAFKVAELVNTGSHQP